MRSIIQLFISTKYSPLFLMIALLISCHSVGAAIPVTTDSRIRTLVYSENEVFPLHIQYGYQTSVEFSENESIRTIFMGNGYAWRITQASRRMFFIKALEGSAQTNMTIITNERTYLFDLESFYPDDKMDEELTYAVRFFYSDHNLDAPPPMEVADFTPPPNSSEQHFNFSYSLTGPQYFAPVKVFDDGKQTFFEFPDNNAVIPHLFVKQNNSMRQLSYTRQGEFIVVDHIEKSFILKLEKDMIHVYNDLFEPSKVAP